MSTIKSSKKLVRSLVKKACIPPLLQIIETAGTSAPIGISTLVLQKILGLNRSTYWPTHFTSVICAPQNIEIGIGTAPGLSPNCYIQGISGIKLGDYTLVGPGVGIISANHDVQSINLHSPSRGVVIGSYCWIGMNAVILPDVRLGDHTVVAAGSIVTRSFSDGYCVIGGNPAKVIKQLDPKLIGRARNKHEYVGYYKASFFLQRKAALLYLIYDTKTDSFVAPSRVK